MEGFCQCGCGQKTNLARQDDPKRGYKKGQPFPYLRNHRKRKSGVEYVVDESGCWVWQRTRTPAGYGNAWDGGRTVGAHRLFYERHVGPIPDGYVIDHLCRNKSCVNPDHLEAVPQAVNIQRSCRGLTDADVRLIRESDEKGYKIAERLGVSPGTVYAVLNGETWVGK